MTLEVTYDETEADPPADWHWSDLLGDYVVVVDASAVIDVDEEAGL